MLDPFDSPIPGQSLTSDSSNPMPFETAPEFTDKNELTKVMFEQLTTPESIEQISGFLEKGASVEAITKILLFTGMASGKFNTDMQLLMIEPVIYIILFIAERLGVEPVMEEEEYLEQDLEAEIGEILNKDAPEIEEIKKKIPTSLLSRLEDIPEESTDGII